MTNPIARSGRLMAAKTLALQLAATLVVSGLLYLGSPEKGISLFTGGAICIIGQAYFALRVFRFAGARMADKVVSSFYAGEAGKFVLVVVMFALVFNFFTLLKTPANAFLLFLGFLMAQSMIWFAALLTNK